MMRVVAAQIHKSFIARAIGRAIGARPAALPVTALLLAGSCQVGTRPSPPEPTARDDRPASAGFVWAAFPEPQVLALLELVRAVVKRTNIDPTQVIGHEHVSPGRKRDPGPAFPWARITAALADRPHSERMVARAVQSHCTRLGFALAGGIDGAWGAQTEAAIAKLVARHGTFYALTAPAKTWAARRAFAEQLRTIPG